MLATPQLVQFASGYRLVDCDLASASLFYFLLRQDYTRQPGWREGSEPPHETHLSKRALSLRTGNPDESKWGQMTLTGMNLAMGAYALQPTAQYVVVDIESSAWAHQTNSDGFEPLIASLAQGGVLSGAITRVKCLGEHLLVVTSARQVLARVTPGQWQLLGQRLPYDFDAATFSNYGFEDVDRFEPNDVYAAGGAGDVWHFDGTAWRQCFFPTNWGLSAVCCGGDGQVYICAGGGTIYRGRGDRWTRVAEGNFALPFKDMVWYEDLLWCTSDYGLWTFDGKTLKDADVPSGVKICAGNLATRDGVLLVAGYGGAAFKRDGEWTVIFHDHELRKLAPKSP